MCRLVHGEGDGCGLDRQAEHAGIAVNSVFCWLLPHQREILAELLVELLADRLVAVYDKSEHTIPFKAPVTQQMSCYGDLIETVGKMWAPVSGECRNGAKNKHC